MPKILSARRPKDETLAVLVGAQQEILLVNILRSSLVLGFELRQETRCKFVATFSAATSLQGDMNKIVSIFKRDERSVEILVMPHFRALYSQAYKYTSNRATAQDLVQDVLVYALENKAKVLALDPILPWLMRCLYHRFVDYFRKYKTDLLPRDDFNFEVLSAPGSNPEDQYFYRQIHEGLARLSLEQKVAVTLFDIEGYSLEEVAHVMELPVGTVKSHLHRGRARLKAILKLTNEELSEPGKYHSDLAGDDYHEL